MGGVFLREMVDALCSWRTQIEFLRCDLVFGGVMNNRQESVDPHMCLSIDLSQFVPLSFTNREEPNW